MAVQIVSESSSFNKKYMVVKRSITFKLTDVPQNTSDPEAFLKNEFRNIVNHITSEADPDDKIGFAFTSNNFHQDAYLSFKKASQVTFEYVWSLLGTIYQSNSEGFKTDSFRLIMTALKTQRGKGRVTQYDTFTEECKKRKGIVAIDNRDNLCLVRALVVAIAYALQRTDLELIRKNRRQRLDKEIQKLMSETGIVIPEEGAAMTEVRQYQNFLKDYKVTVYEYGSKGRNVLFEGPEASHKLNLLFHNNHFNVITNLTAAFGCSYFCEACHVPFDHKNRHRCQRTCPCCQKSPPCMKTSSEIQCEQCNRWFRSTECFENHQQDGTAGSICDTVMSCLNCLKTHKRSRNHICNEIFCKICRDHKPQDHKCYMQVDRKTPKLDETVFVFYDFETIQSSQSSSDTKVHIPNLCVLQQVCDKCMDEDKLVFCKTCGYRQTVIDQDIIPTFMRHIFDLRKKFKSIIAIAHNSQAFDCQFILKYIIEETDLEPRVIMRGNKILLMQLKKVRFIDSLNYFPMSLAVLPKAFELSELKKGYFPHLFNIEENASYVGSIPDVTYYSPDDMMDNVRKDFLQWYEANKTKVFNMKKELVDYCISDVDILTKACLKFRQMFMKESNVCPFSEAVTLPAACNLLYRRNFLKPNTIGIIPPKGYRNIDNQSKIASMWLIWEEEKRGIIIQHSIRQREVSVNGLRVDGFFPDLNLVFEFYGCFFHGHSCIGVEDRNQPLSKDPSDTLENRFERTLRKADRLKNFGYTVIEKWECEFRDTLTENKELESHLRNHPVMIHSPLEPRDAFYGGRTGNTRSYYKVKEDEKIKYVDVCSLYPWVCKYGKFPIGHPEVYLFDECKNLDLQKIDGLVKCKVLPPQNLYHPVLPLKMNDKLMFVLCNKCGLKMNQGTCDHEIEERTLLGTWVVAEVRLALEKGYELLEVYEIWKYNTTQFDKSAGVQGLFSELIDKFLKIKTEASGWPRDCVTEAERLTFIEKFLDREDIRLEFQCIVKNPGLRSLAKLILNSFWGKFGQRENLPKTTIVKETSHYQKLINDPSIDIINIEEINHETLVVNWSVKEEAEESLSTVNVAIASFVTAQARIKLYSYLDHLGSRVLYYDTDSVIYVAKEGDWEVPTGCFLGDMTDELAVHGEGSYITEFASGGPKNYSFIGVSPLNQKTFQTCKVKGIKLSYSAGSLINFYSMKNLLMDGSEGSILVKSKEIRVEGDHNVVTKPTQKVYKLNSTKRKFDDGHDSVPYGFKTYRRFE